MNRRFPSVPGIPAPPVAPTAAGCAAAPNSAPASGMPAGVRQAPGHVDPAHPAATKPSPPVSAAPRPGSLLWAVLAPIVQAERARQSEAAARQQASVTPPAAPQKIPDERIRTTREAAKHFKVSVKTFLRDYAPLLHPLTPSIKNRKRQHRRWDVDEFNRLIDRMTGGKNGHQSSPEELAFIKAQMEKRLE
jgi:hypothetical protein